MKLPDLIASDDAVRTKWQAWRNATPEVRTQLYNEVLAEGNNKIARVADTGYILSFRSFPSATYYPYPVITDATGTNAATLLAEINKTILTPKRAVNALAEGAASSPPVANFRPDRYTARMQAATASNRTSDVPERDIKIL